MGVRRRAFVWAAATMIALGVYLQIVEWIDLRPWNNIRNGNGQEMLDVITAAVMAGLASLLFANVRWAAWFASLGLIAWVILQIQTWWLPYFAGASPAWSRTYAKWFSDNLQVLPSSPGHLPPDVSHLVLHILILLALATSLIAALSRSTSRGHAQLVPAD